MLHPPQPHASADRGAGAGSREITFLTANTKQRTNLAEARLKNPKPAPVIYVFSKGTSAPQTAPPTRIQAFKPQSQWRLFLLQTCTLLVMSHICLEHLTPTVILNTVSVLYMFSGSTNITVTCVCVIHCTGQASEDSCLP